MERLGVSYQEAARLNPRLIYTSISGYGQSGFLAGRAAFDPIAQAVSGVISVTGPVGGEQVRCGVSVADILAGQNAAFAILAAILHRERTGKGQWIDIALADSCISAMTGVNQFYLTDGLVPKPLGNGFATNAPGNAYPCRDGKVMVLAVNNSEWRKLAAVLDQPQWLERTEFASVSDRLKNRVIALEFKLGGEVLRTAIVRGWSELAILGAIIFLRGALTLIIRWEIRSEQTHLC